MKQQRTYQVVRKTKETDIQLSLNLDGEGRAQIDTGVPFLDHMLELFARHGQFDLEVKADGDIQIDAHHTTEDVGICLGQAILHAVGDKKGIRRYGNSFVPMDETLGQVVIDLSNRPHLEYHVALSQARVGTFDTELVHEFFWKVALEGRMNLHAILHYGRNTHHQIEALFKAFGRALDEATAIDPRIKGVLTTKGML
jgi:imidazoleglycerol-phosphate dehydratase